MKESVVKIEPFGYTKIQDLEEFLAEISGELALRRGGTQLLGELGRPAELAGRISEASDDSFVLTVTLDDILSGLIWGKIVANEFGDRICLVPVFSVLKDVRRHGVGSQLFNSLEEWARSRNVTAIEFTALPGDRHTKNFCEANGLIARSLKMHKRISAC